MIETLDQIALRHGTDKASSLHGYTAIYEPLLEPLRDEPITLLELGFGGHDDASDGGASARMWRDYLPKATVVVIDVAPKLVIPDGVNFRRGSQADPEFIGDLAGEFGPFDVIVDDASHLSSLTIKSFELLYPHLAPGGLYAVEDTHMAYHDHYYGTVQANRNPDEPTSIGAPTAMQFFKRLADEVNYRTDGVLFPVEHWLGYRLEWVAFHFNLALIRKAGA